MWNFRPVQLASWVRGSADYSVNVLQTHPYPHPVTPLPIFTLQGKSLKLLKKGENLKQTESTLSKVFSAVTHTGLALCVQERTYIRLCAAELEPCRGSLSDSGNSSDGSLKKEGAGRRHVVERVLDFGAVLSRFDSAA